MNTRHFIAIALLAFAVAGVPVHSQDAAPTRPDGGARLDNFRSENRIPGQYFVFFKNFEEMLADDASRRAANTADVVLPQNVPTSEAAANALAEALAKAFNGRLAEIIAPMGDGRWGFLLVDTTERDILRLARDPRVAYIEPNQTVQVDSSQAAPAWHLDRLDESNWPLDAQYTYYSDGTGVTIWILDSGVRYTHEEFGGRAGTSVRDCTVLNCATVLTGNISGSNPNQADCYGHGTHVASAAAGIKHGVAKNATIRAVKVVEECTSHGNFDAVLRGINWVIANQASGPDIINVSFHATGSTVYDTAINNALSHGITVVSATANSSANACTLSPARVPGVIAVGVSDRATNPSRDVRWFESAYGTCLSMFAPGGSILTATAGIIACTGQINGGAGGDDDYCVVSGSSLSTPIVSGIAALVLQKRPSWTPAQVKAEIINASTKNVLQGNLGSGSPNRLANSRVWGNNPAGTGAGSGGGGLAGPAQLTPILQHLIFGS